MIISCKRDISEILDHENILESFVAESSALSKVLI